jgi:hypothetical protein
MSDSFGHSLLTALKSDVLPLVAEPLETFFGEIKPVGGQPVDPQKVIGAWIKLHGALLETGPQSLGLVEGDIITSLQAKLAKFAPPATQASVIHASVTG